MARPVYKEGQEIKQGGVRTHADGSGHDAKATSGRIVWLGLFSCSRAILQMKPSLFLPMWQSLVSSISNWDFSPIPFALFSFLELTSSQLLPSFRPKGIVVQALIKFKLPCGLTFVKGRDVWASVSNQQLFWSHGFLRNLPPFLV